MNGAGAVFTVAVCWALGRLLFARLGLRLRRVEHDLLAAVVGAALLSVLVFGLCVVGLARTWMFLGLGVIAVGCWLPSTPLRLGSFSSSLPRLWKWLFGTGYVFYGLLYLSNSLAPEHSPDGSTYHLGLVAKYFRDHGFVPITTNFYASLTQGAEMLYLHAFAFGRHSAAATVHCCFLMALPLLMLCYGRRIERPIAGAAAGMLFYLSPLAGIDGVSAYNDVALATAVFAVFYLLEIWREGGETALLVPIGLLSGFCFAIKYTGFVTVLYAVFVPVIARPGSGRVRRVLVVGGMAALVALPWLVKNWIVVGNPVSPFLNSVFRNPYVHVSFESFYRGYFQSYGLKSFAPLFRMLTVTGELGGQLGPVFLLAPLALLSLRWREGRHCLLAALFFLIPYPQNLGARFLLPVLPFVALGIALALEYAEALQALLVVAALVLAWPRVIDKYRAPAGGWQISGMPWQAALGVRDREKWLADRFADYRLAKKINDAVPAGKKIWSSVAVAEAYSSRPVLVYYYSAECELIQDMLLTAITDEMQPRRALRLRFASTRFDTVRLVEKKTRREMWSISELLFFHHDQAVKPRRVGSEPFPWDIGLAIDGNPLTRWRSWEPMRAGMHVDAYFGGQEVDRVDLRYSPDQGEMELSVQNVNASAEQIELPPPGDLRRAATQAIKSRGVEYLLIGGQYPTAASMRADTAGWGLQLRGERDLDRIYQIQ